MKRSTNDRDKLGFNARGERKQKSQGKAINQLANKIETLKENLVEVPDYRKKIDIKFLKTSSEYVSIQAENLSKMFSEVNLFDSVSFNLKQGDRLVITGNNGSGKTTILRMVYGNLNPDKGSITLSKNKIENIVREHIFGKIFCDIFVLYTPTLYVLFLSESQQ